MYRNNKATGLNEHSVVRFAQSSQATRPGECYSNVGLPAIVANYHLMVGASIQHTITAHHQDVGVDISDVGSSVKSYIDVPQSNRYGTVVSQDYRASAAKRGFDRYYLNYEQYDNCIVIDGCGKCIWTLTIDNLLTEIAQSILAQNYGKGGYDVIARMLDDHMRYPVEGSYSQIRYCNLLALAYAQRDKSRTHKSMYHIIDVKTLCAIISARTDTYGHYNRHRDFSTSLSLAYASMLKEHNELFKSLSAPQSSPLDLSMEMKLYQDLASARTDTYGHYNRHRDFSTSLSLAYASMLKEHNELFKSLSAPQSSPLDLSMEMKLYQDLAALVSCNKETGRVRGWSCVIDTLLEKIADNILADARSGALEKIKLGRQKYGEGMQIELRHKRLWNLLAIIYKMSDKLYDCGSLLTVLSHNGLDVELLRDAVNLKLEGETQFKSRVGAKMRATYAKIYNNSIKYLAECMSNSHTCLGMRGLLQSIDFQSLLNQLSYYKKIASGGEPALEQVQPSCYATGANSYCRSGTLSSIVHIRDDSDSSPSTIVSTTARHFICCAEPTTRKRSHCTQSSLMGPPAKYYAQHVGPTTELHVSDISQYSESIALRKLSDYCRGN